MGIAQLCNSVTPRRATLGMLLQGAMTIRPFNQHPAPGKHATERPAAGALPRAACAHPPNLPCCNASSLPISPPTRFWKMLLICFSPLCHRTCTATSHGNTSRLSSMRSRLRTSTTSCKQRRGWQLLHLFS